MGISIHILFFGNLHEVSIFEIKLIVHYAASAMKRFLTSVSLQHEPKATDVITLVKKTFFRTSIVRNFILRGVKMRISAREACVKPHLRTRSDIKLISFGIFWIFKNFYKILQGFLFSWIDFVLRIGVQRHPFWMYNNFRVLLLRFIEMYVCHCYFLIEFY